MYKRALAIVLAASLMMMTPINAMAVAQDLPAVEIGTFDDEDLIQDADGETVPEVDDDKAQPEDFEDNQLEAEAQEQEEQGEEAAEETADEMAEDTSEEGVLPDPVSEEVYAEKDLVTAGDDIASGSYESTTWRIDKDGTLYVSGTGEFAPSLDVNDVEARIRNIPWMAYGTQIMSARVELSGTKDFSFMFWNAIEMRTVDFSKSDTGSATDMSHMFYQCWKLESIDLSEFNTQNVVNMDSMFYSCRSLTVLDMSPLDMGNVQNMHAMFQLCYNLTSLVLTGINTENVTDMSYTFASDWSLGGLDLKSLDTSKVENMQGMFSEAAFKNADFNSLDTSNVTNMENMFHFFGWVERFDNETRVDFKPTFETSKVTTMRGMFSSARGLRSVDLTGLDTRNVTDMSDMFAHCVSLNIVDMSGLDLSKVKYMVSMFDNSAIESVSMTGCNTVSLESTAAMFIGCNNLESFSFKDLNTSSVTAMDSMFSYCSNLSKLDLAGIDTSSVKSFAWMFRECTELSDIDVSMFDTKVASAFGGMFEGCTSLKTIDLSDWDFQSGDDVHVYTQSMFYGDESLKTVYLPKNIKYIDANMFNEADSVRDIYYQGSSAQWKSVVIAEGNDILDSATIHYDYIKKNPCGVFAYWDFSDGILTISGSGDMSDFDFDESEDGEITIPWWNRYPQIDTVIIEQSIWSIGANSFSNHENLKEVYIPLSVRQIRENAFRGTQVKDVYYAGTESEWKLISIFDGNDSLKGATIHYAAKDLRIIKIKSPAGCEYKYNDSLHAYTFFIPNDLKVSLLNIVVSPGASWEIYNDPSCTTKADSHNLTFNSPYDNYYFVKVWNGADSVVYTFNFRHGSVIAMDSELVNKKIYYHVDDYTDPAKCRSDVYDANVSTLGGSMNLGGFYENVKWGGDLFSDISRIPNRDLALVAGALSAAAEGRKGMRRYGSLNPLETADGNDGEYILQAYKDLGFREENIYLFSYPGSAKNLGKVDNDFNDDQKAFSIAYSPIRANEQEYQLLVVTARGSITNQEFMSDAFTGSRWDGKYKKNVFDLVSMFEYEIRKGFDYVLKQHPEIMKDKTKVKILINGHSLGGAAANLFAVYCDDFTGVSKNNIYVYTFGGINTFAAETSDTPLHVGYENIHNIYNFNDTFGPRWKGNRLPSGVGTMKGRFGHLDGFSHNFLDDNYAITSKEAYNHVMAGYLYAVRKDLVNYEKRTGRWCVTACPVDVEVYKDEALVGRITDNVVDESVTTIPMYVIEDVKHYLLPEGGDYEVKITATDEGVMSCNFEDMGGEDPQFKVYSNIELVPDKVIETVISDDTELSEASLFVLDEKGEPVKEILENGQEIAYSKYGEVLTEDVPESGIIPDGIWLGGVKTLTYDGTKQTQNFRVYDGTDLLVPKTDYTVSYKNNQNAYVIEALDKLTSKELKTVPQVILAMKGNYSGKQTFYFSIDKRSIEDTQAFRTYLKKSGKTYKPAIAWNGKELKLNKDYTLDTTDTVATFTGFGNFTGTRTLEIAASTEAAPKQIAMSKVKVTAIPAQFYTGSTYDIDSLKAADGSAPFDFFLTYNNARLTEGVDYRITRLLNAREVGKATVILEGLNASGDPGALECSFVGERRITFNIKAYPMTGDKVSVTSSDGREELTAQYQKGGAKPAVRVMFGATVLKEGRDYTLKYSGNTKYPATKATVTITGKGNFASKASKGFSVAPRAFTAENGIKVIATDKAYSKKANQYATTVKVFDYDGKLLKAGTDYDKKIVYLKDGAILDKKSHPEAGDVITVSVTGKGGYSSDSIETTYRILEAGATNDLSKATIKIKNQDYNKGKPVFITSQEQLGQATIGKQKTALFLSTDGGATGDFMVVPGSYVNNRNKGTAQVTFMGINGTSGTKTVKYKIGARSILDIWFGWF